MPKLTDNQRKALDFINREGRISGNKIIVYLNLDDNKKDKFLSKLAGDGLVSQRGEPWTPGGISRCEYSITRKGKEAIGVEPYGFPSW
jgi:predicted transcriptional regulator